MNLIRILIKLTISLINKVGKLSVDKKVSLISIFLRELVSEEKKPEKSLELLLKLDRKIYFLTGRQSIRYEGDLHAKRKYTTYHEFFIDNINEGDRVLDIGCGKGILSYAIISKLNNVELLGIDLNKHKIDYARNHYEHPHLKFIVGNALTDLPEDKFDVVILSNVLEHIEHRVELLMKIKDKIRPSKYLIRVPLLERDWRVPLMKELGLDYRQDATHHIEYTQEAFFQEMSEAGLKVESYTIRWSEIRAVVKAI